MFNTLQDIKALYEIAYNREPTDQEIFDYAQGQVIKEYGATIDFLRGVVDSLRAENAQLRRGR